MQGSGHQKKKEKKGLIWRMIKARKWSVDEKNCKTMQTYSGSDGGTARSTNLVQSTWIARNN